MKDFHFFTVRKLTINFCKMDETFSTTPLKCCHFNLQNVKYDKMTNTLFYFEKSLKTLFPFISAVVDDSSTQSRTTKLIFEHLYDLFK